MPMKLSTFAVPLLVSAQLLCALPAWAAGGAGGEEPSLPASRLEVAMTLYAGGIYMLILVLV